MRFHTMVAWFPNSIQLILLIIGNSSIIYNMSSLQPQESPSCVNYSMLHISSSLTSYARQTDVEEVSGVTNHGVSFIVVSWSLPEYLRYHCFRGCMHEYGS